VSAPCLYVKNTESVKLFIALYVDDLLLFSNDESEKCYVKNHLMSKFEMKDFGEAKNVLGIRRRAEKKENYFLIKRNTLIMSSLSLI
jgi:hypothetical protein